MSFQLYPHQQTFINGIKAKLGEGHRRVLGQAPTGFGKTVVATDITLGALNKNNRVWFVVHRKELLRQTEEAFLSAGITADYIAAGHKYRNADVSLCGIQTLNRRMTKIASRPDIVIWDEAHHCPSSTYSEVMNSMPNATHIGLSATPIRLDGRGLKHHFDALVPGPSTNWLIQNGYLADYDVYSCPSPNLQGVRKIAGDYSKKQLADRMDTADLTGNAVAHYLELSRGKQAIGFCINVEHSMHTCAAFKNAGVVAEHLDATTDKRQRQYVMEKFRGGDIEVLFNVDLFGEGVDVPSVQSAILLRPTASLGLFLQQVGRALRRKPDGSRATIIDHAGNVMNHGLPDDDRAWSLEGKQARSGDRDITTKQCSDCFHIHRPAPRCPKCGYEYEREIKQILVDEAAKLEELDKEAMRKRHRYDQGRANDLDGLIAVGKQRGMKNPEGWARHVLDGREAKELKQKINKAEIEAYKEDNQRSLTRKSA